MITASTGRRGAMTYPRQTGNFRSRRRTLSADTRGSVKVTAHPMPSPTPRKGKPPDRSCSQARAVCPSAPRCISPRRQLALGPRTPSPSPRPRQSPYFPHAHAWSPSRVRESHRVCIRVLLHAGPLRPPAIISPSHVIGKWRTGQGETSTTGAASRLPRAGPSCPVGQ